MPTRGDIITAQGVSPAWASLAKGSAGAILKMGANEPEWSGTDWADCTGTTTWTGIDDWTGGWKGVMYRKMGELVFLKFTFGGHMNAGSAQLRMSLPVNLVNDLSTYFVVPICDNGTWQLGGLARLDYSVSPSLVYFGVGWGVDNFNSGAGAVKGAIGSLWYRGA